MSRSRVGQPAGRRRAYAWSALTVAALVALSVVSAAGAARSPEPSGTGDGEVNVVQMPLGVSNQPVTVVAQLAGDPVAVVEANQDRKLSDGEREQVKDSLRSKQDSIIPSIEQLGGRVEGQYQSAINGVKVTLPASKVTELRALPNVIDVQRVIPINPTNVTSVPYIGAPQLWSGALGIHGENIKIAIIDTGIDYTNANFGSDLNRPGYVNYTTASANSTVDPAIMGVPSWEYGPDARVKGGYDFVGDNYNANKDAASYQPIPHPDPNPLDCFGHGSHVAGTAAGGGITSAGNPYTGPYNSSIYTSPSPFRVGPGVAPKADLYALRVFGCQGSTDVVVDAIDWAVDHDMDVINMSLGSTFGSAKTPDAVAATNAAKSGVIVVAAAGNDGPNPYMTGSPAAGEGTISVAATDAHQTFPGVHVAFGNGTALDAINANENNFADGTSFAHVKVVTDNTATPEDESLGCSPGAYGTLLPNTLAIVKRGTCARVAKAIYGQQAGAAAVGMINNAPGYPPVEGPITSNPDTGDPANVTIPFLGIRLEDATKAGNANGSTATIAHVQIPNPGFSAFASFSSGGPANGTSALKPDISAPGVSVVSTANGTGNGAATNSGTSMATPHVAGVAALVKQAHPDWRKVDYWKAAIVNTADPAAVAGFTIRGGGTGLVQPVPAAMTQVVALGDRHTGSLSFPFQELKSDFSSSKQIRLKNLGSSPATFSVATGLDSGVPHTATASTSQVTVPARGEATVNLRLSVPAASVPSAGSGGLAFSDAAGMVTLTPVGGSNNGVALHVPYYLVPRSLSNVNTKLARKVDPVKTLSTTATITNDRSAPIAGDADWYAWGLSDPRDRNLGAADLRAVGVQSFSFPSASDPNRQLIVFAANTFHRWSSPSTQEFDILVDVNGDKNADYDVVGADQGALQTGVFNGRLGTFVIDLRTNLATINFLATAPTDGSTALMPITSSQLCRPGSPCLNATNPRFTYQAVSFDLNTGASDTLDGTASYNPWHPAISQGMFDTVPPGGSASETVTIDPAEWAHTPALGSMVVTLDNKSGSGEAQLISVGGQNHH